MIKKLRYVAPLLITYTLFSADGAAPGIPTLCVAKTVHETFHTIDPKTLSSLQTLVGTIVQAFPTQQALTRGAQNVAIIGAGCVIGYASAKIAYTAATDETLTNRERAIRATVGLGGLGIGLALIAKAPELIDFAARFGR